MKNLIFLNLYKFLLVLCITILTFLAYVFQDAILSKTNKFMPKFQSLNLNQNLLNIPIDISKTSPSINYPNIAIIQLSNKKQGDHEYHVYAESRRNKKEYADKHNYTVFVDEPTDFSRHVYWYKFISIQKAFNITRPDDWVWLVDSDTIITNMNIELNRLPHYATKLNYHIILTRSCSDINGGSILYRNSPLALNFVRDAWNTMGKEVDISDEWRDQRAVIVTSKKPAYKDAILFVPVNCMNSIPLSTIQKYPKQCANQTEWREGDFLVHFAGNHNEKLFFEYVEKGKALNDKNNSQVLKEFNTKNWLNYINEWRKEKNLTLLF